MNAPIAAARGYVPMFPLGPAQTVWRQLDVLPPRVVQADGTTVLRIAPQTLSDLAFAAFADVSHLLRTGHLAQLRAILDDPEASANDRFVALDLLKNATIAAHRVLPMCQDTGTAIVFGKKGQRVWVDGNEEAALSAGVARTYAETNLRYSQMAPLSMFEEVNTGTNLPVQFDIYASPGEDHADEFHFMFVAKGGGSANKTFLYQETRALLEPQRFVEWIGTKIRTLGTSACPPYHLAIVVGGTSAETTLKTVKLASTRYLDTLPDAGSPAGQAFRDRAMEAQVLELTRTLGVGAQFGGKYFCHDVRVIRLPRHGASLPIGIGVSCSADRQILAKITPQGVFLEQLETDPAQFLPTPDQADNAEPAVRIDLNMPMAEIRRALSPLPVGTRVMLSGPMVVARDIAHAKLAERLRAGQGLPDYIKDHPVYYAGPAKTPQGYATGSFGPTTAGRMDSYVEEFQAAGGSLVMLAKGNRGRAVRDACRAHGGFYLGSVGGPAARLAQDCIRRVEVLEFPELGMEAVWRIEVEDFPAFVVIDDKGPRFLRGFELMRFTVDRLDHVVLNCAEMEKTASWYQRVLGMDREEFGEDCRTALKFGGQKINLRPEATPQEGWASAVRPVSGSADLCFITAVASEDVLDHLESCGVAVEAGPVPREGALGPMISVYCRDPDGNLIEISTYLDSAD